MESQSKTSLKHIWQAQIRQIAARNPRLVRQIWQNRQVYFDRFAHYYQWLANLPRKFRSKFLRRMATTLAGAALILALGQALPARAAVITVDGIVCTLAEALTSANNDNAAGNGCVDGNGADVIDLQTDVLLSIALPVITTEVILEGNGHTIDGNDTFRVFVIMGNGDLTLNEATIMQGTGGLGGGFYNGGTVILNNSTLSDNSASHGGGIFNAGLMELNNSTLTGNSASVNGGGIRNQYGTLIVNNSTLSGNSSGNHGGGIWNSGTVELNNSTLSGNIASSSGGGVRNYNGTLTVNNSTLTGNSANTGGGISNNGNTGTVTLNNSTLIGNTATSGGGIGNGIQFDQGGTLSLNFSIISGNAAVIGAEVFNQNSGIVNTNNYNVVGYGGDARSYGFTPGVLDIIPPGALNTVLDILLADNGGPTFTHALVSGSVAIDAAPSADCLVPPINGLDQRGYARNLDGNGMPSSNECDTGAFEFVPSGLPTATPTATNITRPTRTPLPTSTPIDRTPPPVSPTRTPTARVTESVTRTPTATPQPIVSLPALDAEASNNLIQWIIASIFAVGNLLFFRSRQF